jgi:hypothetical protein
VDGKNIVNLDTLRVLGLEIGLNAESIVKYYILIPTHISTGKCY